MTHQKKYFILLFLLSHGPIKNANNILKNNFDKRERGKTRCNDRLFSFIEIHFSSFFVCSWGQFINQVKGFYCAKDQ